MPRRSRHHPPAKVRLKTALPYVGLILLALVTAAVVFYAFSIPHGDIPKIERRSK